MITNLLTHSRMASYKTCPRKHHFEYVAAIRRDIDGAPLRMGSALHEGLDALKGGLSLDEACQQVYLNYATLPAWANTDEAVEEWAVECEIVVRLLTAWQWRWADSRIQIVATEQAFDLPLVNPATGAASRTWRIAGKIDAIVRLADGRLAVMEHKTTSDDLAPDSDYWRRLRVDQQISHYFLAARALGYDVQTVLYDCLKKPGIRPKLIGKGEDKRRETAREYGDRLTLDIAERPDHYLARQEIPRLESDLDEFRSELWDIGKAIAEGRAYRNTNACVSPYRCAYLDICSSNIDVTNTVPSGFVRLTSSLHPELAGATHDSSTHNSTAQTPADATVTSVNGQAVVV